MSSYTSAIRYQSLYENRNSWNLLWPKRKSSAPQKDCSRPSVTSLGGVLLGRPPQNPFWSHMPLQPPHQTPSPPLKLFPSVLPCLSDPSLLVLFLMPPLEASGGSRTTAVLIPRLPTSTPTLAKRLPRVPVSYPHDHAASAEHPHRSNCPGDCTKSSKQDPKVGTVSFKLQT